MARTKSSTAPSTGIKPIPFDFDKPALDMAYEAVLEQAQAYAESGESYASDTWVNATKKAKEKLSIVSLRSLDDPDLLLIASDSGNVYAASRDECQCTSYEENGAWVGCWHRAAYAIVVRYNDIIDAYNEPV